MTLRVHFEIIPYGDESMAYEIHRLNISNIGPIGLHRSEYQISEEKPNPGDYDFRDGSTYQIIPHGTVEHTRTDGAFRLVLKALKKVLDG